MITFDNVTKLYAKGARPALDSVSLQIDQGEFVFLVGPSGSGKSTMLSLILASIRPTSGHVRVLDKDVSQIPVRKVPLLRRQIGTVFQDFRLLDSMTVYENVALALQVIGASKSRIVKDVPRALEMVELDGKEKRKVTELSGGERQRVTIARAMVNQPHILLADEPTGNLDPTTGLSIMRVLDRINRAGTTVVMATHDQKIVNDMRRRVVELSEGTLVRDQSTGIYGGSR